MKRLAIYCGSNPGTDPSFTTQILNLSAAMAAAEMDLVYGGSSSGLMGQIADNLLAQGRQVFGVMPHELVRWEQAHHGLTELHTVDSMHERKQQMADLADGFLAIPGGIGTLEEIVEMISWAQLGIHHKPCALLNVNGYYDHLLAFFDHAVDQGLMREQTRGMILVDDSPQNLLSRMQTYQSPVQYHWRSGA